MEKYVVTENMMMQGDVCFVQGGVEASMLKQGFCVCVFQFSEDHQTDPVNVLDAWKSNYTPPTWKPEVCVSVCV